MMTAIYVQVPNGDMHVFDANNWYVKDGALCIVKRERGGISASYSEIFIYAPGEWSRASRDGITPRITTVNEAIFGKQ